MKKPRLRSVLLQSTQEAVEHERSVGENTRRLSALPLPKCFTTEQSSVEASLFVL